MSDQTVNYLPNPNDSTRYEILRNAFTNAGRPEDFENVVELLNPPPDITSHAASGAYKNLKVGIIGAGLAGLSAAFELREQKLRCMMPWKSAWGKGVYLLF